MIPLLENWHRIQLHADLTARDWSVSFGRENDPQLPAYQTSWHISRSGLAEPLTLEFRHSPFASQWSPARDIDECNVVGFGALPLYLRQPVEGRADIRIAWLQEREVFLDFLETLPRETGGIFCPGCFALALPELNRYHMCPVCGFEEEGVSLFDLECGGANHNSVIDARFIFPDYHRCDPYDRVEIRDARPEEIPSPNWPYRFTEIEALARKILPDVDSWRRPVIGEVFRCIEPGGRTGTVVEVEDGADGTWARVRVRLHPDTWNGESHLWVTRRDWEGMRVWLDL